MEKYTINFEQKFTKMIYTKFYSKFGFVNRTIDKVKRKVQRYKLKEEYKHMDLPQCVYDEYTSIPQWVISRAIYLTTYSRTSMRQSAKICGIDKGTIAYHMEKMDGEITFDKIFGDTKIKRTNVVVDEIYHNVGKKMTYKKNGEVNTDKNKNVENHENLNNCGLL